MYSIEIENLTKKFKEKTAVNNVSLKIKQGELFSLLGTNGAGKTTTIKMLYVFFLPQCLVILLMKLWLVEVLPKEVLLN